MKFSPLFVGLVFFFIGALYSLEAFPLLDEQEKTSENSIDNNIDADARLRSSSSSDSISSLDDSNAGEPTAGSLQGVSVAPVTSSVLYRLSKGGWQESDLTKKKSEEQWKPMDRFASNDRGERTWSEVPIDDRRDFPLMFIEKYNRADDIEKKITAYQKDLNEEQIKVPSIESEDRVYLLKHLIPTLNRARIYQNEMVRHLAKQDYSNDKKIAALQTSGRLARTMQINENPNKIEKIASQLEQHYDEIVLYRVLLDVLQKHIDALPSNEAIREKWQKAVRWQRAKRLLNEIIGHCQTLIEQKAAYAQALEAPCKATDESTQARINQYALKFTEEENEIFEKQNAFSLIMIAFVEIQREWINQFLGLLESQIEEEKKQAHPRKRVIHMHTRSKEMFQQAAASNDETGGRDLSNAGMTFLHAANEMKRLVPRERVIEMYIRSAECSQQAAAASDETVSGCLEGASQSFYYAANEIKQFTPRERLIEINIRLAECSQQAAAANDKTVRKFLIQAVDAFFNAAEEARELNPREDVINDWLQKANDAEKKAKTGSTCTIS